jgi:hypothetical protein
MLVESFGGVRVTGSHRPHALLERPSARAPAERHRSAPGAGVSRGQVPAGARG